MTDNSQPNGAHPAPTNPTASPINPEAMSREAEVREALRQVVDPEIGLDVIALGLIRDVDIHPDRAHVKMMLTTPFCPYGPQMLEQVRMTTQEVLSVPTTIEFTPELWDPSMIEEGAAQDWGLFY
jgi:metal-sulfur cluster biosynthetic enzyme